MKKKTWRLDLFGLSSMKKAPERDLPERKGAARYVQVLWDNLGKLLLGNAICFAGFLPAMLGISLGLVYESFWLTLAGGVVGGAVAGPFWTAMLELALRCYQGSSGGWLSAFGRTLRRTLTPAAAQGAVLGGVVAGLLSVGRFCAGLMEDGTLPALPVWMVLIVDCFLASLAASLLFPPLCFGKQRFPERARSACAMLPASPARVLIAALALLLWCALGISLFPVSVPFAVVLGFWPVALLTAQLQRPALLERFGGLEADGSPAPGAAGKTGYTVRQRGEVWWRRHWAVAAAVFICIGLALGVVQTFSAMREPDLQVAFVHSETLPDAVRSALEASLSEAVGDRNGDGAAIVQINDYQVTFDGTAENADVQAAGSTLLVTDLSGGESSLFIVEDAEGFLALYGDQVAGQDARTWGEYPALAALDAGTYSTVLDIDTNESGQALLQSYTVLPRADAGEGALGALLNGAE